MKIGFFTEMHFQGKVPRTHPNMRTEFAWMCALQATHYNIFTEGDIPKLDLAIVILPKKEDQLKLSDAVLHIKENYCKTLAIMQEGPFWYFQDFEFYDQIYYFNTLTTADIIYVHNQQDKSYFQGLLNKEDVRVLPSLMIEDPITEVVDIGDREGVMIGGNFVSWYGGFDSYNIALEATAPNTYVYGPMMGRKAVNEDVLVTQVPYVEWNKWIKELSKRRIGVHLMRTHAAGTFALNCAYLGIPCIGYEGLDTQRILHPQLTVKDGDLKTARELARKLKNDQDFHTACSRQCYHLYRSKYSEKIFVKNFMEQFSK